MLSVIFLLLIFLIVVFSALLYYKIRYSRVYRLNKGECPNCGQRTKVFFDQKTKTSFKSEIITKRALSNTCSGINEIEFTCKSCDLKEVYSQSF